MEGARTIAKTFTAIGVRAIKTEGYHRDRGESAARGLYVQVRPAEGGGFTRSWLYRFTSPITRKERWMGLGSTDVISLAEARDLARAARRLVTLGADPIEKRRETIKAERDALIRDRASRMTFRQCADAFLQSHDKDRQWRVALDLAGAAFGDLPVGEIDTAMVVKFLEPHWRKTPVTASRHRGRIEAVLDWATVHMFRQGDNPARWSGHLEHIFAAKSAPEPHKAMPFADVPDFLSRIRGSDAVASAIEFTILTAARRGESLNATWSEIDFDKRQWVIPGERMKGGVEHTVPLSDRVLAILEALPRTSSYIFVNAVGKRIAHTAMRRLLVRTINENYTLHGFRSAFRDWAGEVSNFDREVIEHALAHKLPDRVEAAYRRGTALDKRRRLMAAWSSYCSGETGAAVVRLHV